MPANPGMSAFARRRQGDRNQMESEMNNATSTIDLNMDALDAIEAPEMDGAEVALAAIGAFAVGVLIGAAIAT